MSKSLKELCTYGEVLDMSVSEIAEYKGVTEQKIRDMAKDDGVDVKDGKLIFPDDYERWD